MGRVKKKPDAKVGDLVACRVEVNKNKEGIFFTHSIGFIKSIDIKNEHAYIEWTDREDCVMCSSFSTLSSLKKLLNSIMESEDSHGMTKVHFLTNVEATMLTETGNG